MNSIQKSNHATDATIFISGSASFGLVVIVNVPYSSLTYRVVHSLAWVTLLQKCLLDRLLWELVSKLSPWWSGLSVSNGIAWRWQKRDCIIIIEKLATPQKLFQVSLTISIEYARGDPRKQNLHSCSEYFSAICAPKVQYSYY